MPSAPSNPSDVQQLAADARTAKKPWVAPRVQTIAAGEAEVGTRSLGRDGAFTTS